MTTLAQAQATSLEPYEPSAGRRLSFESSQPDATPSSKPAAGVPQAETSSPHEVSPSHAVRSNDSTPVSREPSSATTRAVSVSSTTRHTHAGQLRALAAASTRHSRKLTRHSGNASVCDVSTRQPRASKGSPHFSASTASSLRRSEKVAPPAAKQVDWGSSPTVATAPRLRCVGKTPSQSSRDDKENCVNRLTDSSSKYVKCDNNSASFSGPTVPKTPNVLRRRSFFQKKSASPAEPQRNFVPNPTPNYLKTGKLPEVKQTRKSQQQVDVRKHPERYQKREAPKPAEERPKLEPTVAEPFPLRSVAKHEEHKWHVQNRLAAEEEADKRRREFQPVTLRSEILQGPTFVPTRSETPLTQPVDLLPYAKERSERTLAFEAEQKMRMEDMRRKEEQAARDREIREEERIKLEYEMKRFKARPVPKSHYKPDLLAAGSDDGKTPKKEAGSAAGDARAGEGAGQTDEASESTDTYSETSATPQGGRVSLLQGLRNSLSPLLGRASTSPSP